MKMFVALFGAALVLSSCQTSTPAVSVSTQDLTFRNLPIGDGRLSNWPRAGDVFPCQTSYPNIGGAFRNGPWMKQDGTFDLLSKATVDGSNTWSSSLDIRYEYAQRVIHISGNSLPNHATGTFPISQYDDAYTYDDNPNTIKAHWLDYNLPPIPIMAPAPRCLPSGAIGIMFSGAILFNALDGQGKDAVAHELQDGCQGHPEIDGQYHYHSLSWCIDDSGAGHSRMLGYALDGFGIFGHRGENGQPLTNVDLDECHGHAHMIFWGGQPMWLYHYHATNEYPYTLGCFRGAPLPAGPPQ
jgi:YHYH protein